MIRPCSCPSSAQDFFHGRGNRVMNICKKGLAVRCTVCSKEYTVSSKESKDTKAKKK